ncbi:MAG: hypothetical protein DRH08_14720 [Deltaproteobacteria bacterium]|nr:MAG: hypothetical protein DRH08_14720 [Deltaproteobacteria bacterium]
MEVNAFGDAVVTVRYGSGLDADEVSLVLDVLVAQLSEDGFEVGREKYHEPIEEHEYHDEVMRGIEAQIVAIQGLKALLAVHGTATPEPKHECHPLEPADAPF